MQTLAERTAHWLEGSPRKSRWKVASEPEFSTDGRLIPDLSGRDSRRASVTGSKRLPAAVFSKLKSWQKKGGTAIIRPLHTCMQRALLFHRSFRRKRCFDYVHLNRQMENIW